jgi:transposase InsO family protein
MGIVGNEWVRRGKHRTRTTWRYASAPRHPDLINRAWATQELPDQWWVADFAYVWTLAGFVYASFVRDVFSRRILGWRVSASKTTPLVLSALEQALFTRRRGDVAFTSTGMVFHSDAGSQHFHRLHRSAHRRRHRRMIGSVGDALDFALMESTVGLYKTEVIDFDPPLVDRPSRSRTRDGRVDPVVNTSRIHHSINKL